MHPEAAAGQNASNARKTADKLSVDFAADTAIRTGRTERTLAEPSCSPRWRAPN